MLGVFPHSLAYGNSQNHSHIHHQHTVTVHHSHFDPCLCVHECTAGSGWSRLASQRNHKLQQGSQGQNRHIPSIKSVMMHGIDASPLRKTPRRVRTLGCGPILLCIRISRNTSAAAPRSVLNSCTIIQTSTNNASQNPSSKGKGHEKSGFAFTATITP
jgi:hypothetical protein